MVRFPLIVLAAAAIVAAASPSARAFAEAVTWTTYLSDSATRTFYHKVVIPTSDGGALAVGNEFNNGGVHEYDIVAVRFAAGGSVMWTRRIYGPSAAVAVDAYELQGGNFLIAGTQWSAPGRPLASARVVVVAIGSGGDSLWKEEYEVPAGSEQGTCQGIGALRNFQSLLVASTPHYSYLRLIDAAGAIGATHMLSWRMSIVLSMRRDAAARITYCAYRSEAGLGVLRVNDNGDSVGNVAIDIPDPRTRDAVSYLAAHAGGHVAFGVLQPVAGLDSGGNYIGWFDAGGAAVGDTLWPASDPDQKAHRVLAVTPGPGNELTIVTDEKGVVWRYSAGVFLRFEIGTTWFANGVSVAADGSLLLYGYVQPNRYISPFVSKVEPLASGVEAEERITRMDLR